MKKAAKKSKKLPAYPTEWDRPFAIMGLEEEKTRIFAVFLKLTPKRISTYPRGASIPFRIRVCSFYQEDLQQ